MRSPYFQYGIDEGWPSEGVMTVTFRELDGMATMTVLVSLMLRDRFALTGSGGARPEPVARTEMH
jgi:hypothetical protein